MERNKVKGMEEKNGKENVIKRKRTSTLGGTSDATTSSSLIVSLMSFDDILLSTSPGG